MITKGERRLRGINWETDIDVYTILYIKQIIKTYFTAQGSLWYSVMISMGLESGREWIYACIWLIRASLVTQLIKNLPATWETWVRKIPWRRERLPTPVFWPGKFHALYSPWGCKELDTTKRLSLSKKKANGGIGEQILLRATVRSKETGWNVS